MMVRGSDTRDGGPYEPSAREGDESGRDEEGREARLRRARESARSSEESSPILLPGGNAPDSGFWMRWKTPLLVVATFVALGATALGLVPVLSDGSPEEFEDVEGLPEEWEQVRAEPFGREETVAGETAMPGGTASSDAADTQATEPEEPGTEAAGTSAAGGDESGEGETEDAPGAEDASAEAIPSTPASRELDRLADSLSAAVARYRERQRDFELNRLECRGLTRGYRQVDETYLGFLRAYNRARARLDSSRRAAIRELMEATDGVNRHFDGTRCPRPE